MDLAKVSSGQYCMRVVDRVLQVFAACIFRANVGALHDTKIFRLKLETSKLQVLGIEFLLHVSPSFDKGSGRANQEIMTLWMKLEVTDSGYLLGGLA